MQVAHPRHRAGACTLNAVGLLPVSRAWRCEGRPPLPHHFVCVETFTLPYLGLAQSAGELWLGVRQRASPPERCSPVSTVIISTTAAAHAD